MQSLREYREGMDVELATVARYLGVSCQTYAHYERHPEELPIQVATRLCSFLGYDFDCLCAEGADKQTIH